MPASHRLWDTVPHHPMPPILNRGFIVPTKRSGNDEKGGTSHAPIDEAREEILRLIARLQRPGPERAAGPPRGASSTERDAAPARSKSGAADGERPVVTEVRQLRSQLEERLSQARLAMRLKTLEARVTQVEERVAHRSSKRPGPPAEDAEHTVSGELRGQLMPDMLQLLSSNALTGVFVVKSGKVENRLYLEEGQICHAEGPGMEGESAFFAVMALEQGRYHFDETAELPEEKTITGNTQFLILEALRQIDEGGGG